MTEKISTGKTRAFALLHFASFLALCTLIATIAIPAWFGQGSVTLERAAILLRRDLRAVQNHAVISGNSVHIEFLPSGDGYRALNDSGDPVVLFSDDTVLDRRYNEDGVFDGVRVHSVSLDSAGPLIYDPNGYALTGGEIVLSLAEEEIALTLSAETGRIEINGIRVPAQSSER